MLAKLLQLQRGIFISGASKGTPGDAKCVTEILGGTKIRKLGGGAKFTFLF